ncbi:hypothetical protein M0804_001949 [Polistes exclamans]|nr:hypothetical protein M0804_001949 [Polistes exclamans]
MLNKYFQYRYKGYRFEKEVEYLEVSNARTATMTTSCGGVSVCYYGQYRSRYYYLSTTIFITITITNTTISANTTTTTTTITTTTSAIAITTVHDYKRVFPTRLADYSINRITYERKIAGRIALKTRSCYHLGPCVPDRIPAESSRLDLGTVVKEKIQDVPRNTEKCQDTIVIYVTVVCFSPCRPRDSSNRPEIRFAYSYVELEKLVTVLNLQVLLELNFPSVVGYNLSNGVLTLSLNLTDIVESIRDIPENFLTTTTTTAVSNNCRESFATTTTFAKYTPPLATILRLEISSAIRSSHRKEITSSTMRGKKKQMPERLDNWWKERSLEKRG